MLAPDIIARSRVTLPELRTRVDELRGAEREVLHRIGTGLLTGQPDADDRAKLRRIREDLDALYAAERLLEIATDVTLNRGMSLS